MSSSAVFVIEARAHLMQQVNDLVRNGYRNWCTGTVPLAKAQAWASKAETLYHISKGKDARTRDKRAGLGSVYLLMYRLDRSLDNSRLGWILLVSDGIHAAHAGEKLRRAEDDPVELFGYQLVRETRAEKKGLVWTWKMKRTAYESWRERIIDVVRRGSDYDVRRMLRDLHSAPGFSAVRAQLKHLRDLVNAEWKRTHKNSAKRGYTLPKIWKARRMHVPRVELSVYLDALREARRAAAAEAGESIALAPVAEPASVYPVVVPDDAAVAFDGDAHDDGRSEVDDECPSAPAEPGARTRERKLSRVEKRWSVRYGVARPAGKKKRRDVRDDRSQPVRQRALPLQPTPARSSTSPANDSPSPADAG